MEGKINAALSVVKSLLAGVVGALAVNPETLYWSGVVGSIVVAITAFQKDRESKQVGLMRKGK